MQESTKDYIIRQHMEKCDRFMDQMLSATAKARAGFIDNLLRSIDPKRPMQMFGIDDLQLILTRSL